LDDEQLVSQENHSIKSISNNLGRLSDRIIRNEKVGCSIHLSGTNKIKALQLFQAVVRLFSLAM